jgi:uncharacterized protein (DUF1684 family)
MDPGEARELLDWKRRVFALYAAVRADAESVGAWRRWRSGRDELFRTHPQSPVPVAERSAFAALEYFPHDAGARVLADVLPAEPATLDIETSGGGEPYRFARIGSARFALAGSEHRLDVFWLDAYGGGVFLPFADATSGNETYGAGRYLLDTVKGADLGEEDGRLVLDFNFAYQPSCSYDPRWVCPLAPRGNRLDVPVRAGERTTGG